jgi:multiple sugar transport system permease protein
MQSAEQVVSGQSGRRVRRRLHLAPWLFLALPLLIYFVWVVEPLFYSFYLSLTNWDGITAPIFIGLKNYQRLLGDRVFYTALVNNIKVLCVFLTIPIAGGLGLALLFNRPARTVNVLKSAIYSPMALSFVVIGLIWSWFYLPNEGFFNTLLRGVGLGFLAQSWLSNAQISIFSITAAASWRQIGYIMILYLAGLQTIDPTLVEAARVDGASPWQVFRSIVFPLLAPVTTIIVVVTVIDSLQFFDLVYIMTQGGPGYASTVLANFMYVEAFINFRYGYGAAIAVVQFLLSFIFIVIYLTYMIRKGTENI